MADETSLSPPPDEVNLGCKKKVSVLYCLFCNKIYHTSCGTRDKNFRSIKSILGVCSCTPILTSKDQTDQTVINPIEQIIANYKLKLKSIQENELKLKSIQERYMLKTKKKKQWKKN